MYPSKNIVQNAMNSKDRPTLVAAVKAAGLVDTLEGPGPFTVFAPTNAAFEKLPAARRGNLAQTRKYRPAEQSPGFSRRTGQDHFQQISFPDQKGWRSDDLDHCSGRDLDRHDGWKPRRSQRRERRALQPSLPKQNRHRRKGVIHVIGIPCSCRTSTPPSGAGMLAPSFIFFPPSREMAESAETHPRQQSCCLRHSDECRPAASFPDADKRAATKTEKSEAYIF